MTKNTLMIVTIEQEPQFNLEELCSACQVTPHFIQNLIEYGILENIPEDLYFTSEHLRRVKIVTHLQKDLEINLAGAALVLDLMDEIDSMRKQLEIFQKSIYFP